MSLWDGLKILLCENLFLLCLLRVKNKIIVGRVKWFVNSVLHVQYGWLSWFIPAMIITCSTALLIGISEAWLPLLLRPLDGSDVLDLHFYHTRRPMSALSNIFPLPVLLGYRMAIWLPWGLTGTLGNISENVGEIWYESQCLNCTRVFAWRVAEFLTRACGRVGIDFLKEKEKLES